MTQVNPSDYYQEAAITTPTLQARKGSRERVFDGGSDVTRDLRLRLRLRLETSNGKRETLQHHYENKFAFRNRCGVRFVPQSLQVETATFRSTPRSTANASGKGRRGRSLHPGTVPNTRHPIPRNGFYGGLWRSISNDGYTGIPLTTNTIGACSFRGETLTGTLQKKEGAIFRPPVPPSAPVPHTEGSTEAGCCLHRAVSFMANNTVFIDDSSTTQPALYRPLYRAARSGARWGGAAAWWTRPVLHPVRTVTGPIRHRAIPPSRRCCIYSRCYLPMHTNGPYPDPAGNMGKNKRSLTHA